MAFIVWANTVLLTTHKQDIFFNAGGVLTLDPSSTQVGAVDEAWDDLFTLGW